MSDLSLLLPFPAGVRRRRELKAKFHQLAPSVDFAKLSDSLVDLEAIEKATRATYPRRFLHNLRLAYGDSEVRTYIASIAQAAAQKPHRERREH